jgi:small subunit ribosomal protein S20
VADGAAPLFIFTTHSFRYEAIQTMANTPQSKKRIRRNAVRQTINHSRISRIRTFIKAVESAIATGKKADAADALKRVQPEMMRGVARGVLHKNTASRKISRLSKRVASLG